MSRPSTQDRIVWAQEALARVQKLKDLMIAVATGGPRIEAVNHDYRAKREELRTYLEALGITDSNPFDDLWAWYGRWSSGDLPSYQCRRRFLSELFAPLLEVLRGTEAGREIVEERLPTGWTRVDRGTEKMREALERARDEEDFQSVGHLGRETLISLAQAVYVREKHAPLDGVEPSATDAKRMLDAFIDVEMTGETNDRLRRHSRSAVDLASELTHKRTATFRLAALCAEAVSSACNQVAIVSGRRDPEGAVAG
ncbi:MAG: hypothetical protein A2W26_08965 [Acidobacteria bacterium RBG_16_64_8]|nr:MAG: hypothetical protein A2W26_08965 [Acidobacteria bacterium RBG_16_64_8]